MADATALAEYYGLQKKVPVPVEPLITITSPNGGETWKRNTTQTIRWSFAGLQSTLVKIDLYRGNTFVRNIISSTAIGTAGLGSFTWKIPASQTSGTGYQVRVTTVDGQFSDISDGTFRIR
jgi:hypothetical protein